jgi:hypothetical protein
MVGRGPRGGRGGVRLRRAAGDGLPRVRRRAPIHQSSAHRASARAAGAAARPVHDPGPVRQRAGGAAVPGGGVALERRSPHARAGTAARRALARRGADHGRGRRVHGRRGARPGHRVPAPVRPGVPHRRPCHDRSHGAPGILPPTGRIPRRAHRPGDPARALAGGGAPRPVAARSLQPASGGQRPVPFRVAHAQPALGVRRQPDLSGHARRPSRAAAAGDCRGGRAGDQARRPGHRRAGRGRHPADARRAGAPGPQARGGGLPDPAQLRPGLEHRASTLRRSTPAACADARPRSALDGGCLSLRLR